MNDFSLYSIKRVEDRMYLVGVLLRARFRLVRDSGGWLIQSNCKCPLTAQRHKTKAAALDALHDFLKGCGEEQLAVEVGDDPCGMASR